MKKTITGFVLSTLFLGVLVFPNISSASTVDELMAMLNSLLAQVASLQQQIAEQTNTTTEWCHTFNTNLKYGDRNGEVKELRTALQKNGFEINTTSGYFDEVISSAVVSF